MVYRPHPYPFTPPRFLLTPVRRAVAVEGGAGAVVAVGAVVSVELRVPAASAVRTRVARLRERQRRVGLSDAFL